MHRNVTAIYRTFATADLVRQELVSLGVSTGDIHVVPDMDDPVGVEGQRTDTTHTDRLYDLHLPEDDLRTYQQSVRRGDYVVSAEVDDTQVARVQEIMRRPEDEAYDLDRRHDEFRDAGLDPYSDPGMRATNDEWIGRRDQDHLDPFTRSYVRNARLDQRRG
ncbi:hypothetical protein [Paracoccus beibuensis]|uniref:hypothetical protein n=1 Tax=Paracoccus beibuensis TaxID=547602 RepID=UPI00223FBA90|nr:hypothetical protein [Paracoccus beibuensis]